MTANNLASQDEQTANIQVTAEYNYMKEDQTTVTVEGRRGAGDSPSDTEDDDSSSGDEGPDEEPGGIDS